jgi:hypothetical protein
LGQHDPSPMLASFSPYSTKRCGEQGRLSGLRVRPVATGLRLRRQRVMKLVHDARMTFVGRHVRVHPGQQARVTADACGDGSVLRRSWKRLLHRRGPAVAEFVCRSCRFPAARRALGRRAVRLPSRSPLVDGQLARGPQAAPVGYNGRVYALPAPSVSAIEPTLRQLLHSSLTARARCTSILQPPHHTSVEP